MRLKPNRANCTPQESCRLWFSSICPSALQINGSMLILAYTQEGIGARPGRGGRWNVEGHSRALQAEWKPSGVGWGDARQKEGASLWTMEVFEQVVEGWQRRGGKEKEKRGHNSRRKKCVCECLLYCGGPTYPSILLRRLSPQEEGWYPLPQPHAHTHILSLPLAASYTHSALWGSSRWRALDRPCQLLQVSHPAPITQRLPKVLFHSYFPLPHISQLGILACLFLWTVFFFL